MRKGIGKLDSEDFSQMHLERATLNLREVQVLTMGIRWNLGNFFSN
jgi:hypothetical protein